MLKSERPFKHLFQTSRSFWRALSGSGGENFEYRVERCLGAKKELHMRTKSLQAGAAVHLATGRQLTRVALSREIGKLLANMSQSWRRRALFRVEINKSFYGLW